MNAELNIASKHPPCKVCTHPAQPFDRALVLGKHTVHYFRCAGCGFIQTEAPYWLEEAYSSAIARQDVGIMARNLQNEQLVTAVLQLLFPSAARLVDYGGGHGIFVRLMRDRGFNFSLYDLYATNDYARGFEYQPGQPCDFLTAFEVLEHLVDPIADLATMMQLSDNVFVSTALVPDPPPKIADWWYYTPTSGQHISLYTLSALQHLAKHFGRTLYTHGSYHLFTRHPISNATFQLATRLRAARLINTVTRRPSLMPQDHQRMTAAL